MYVANDLHAGYVRLPDPDKNAVKVHPLQVNPVDLFNGLPKVNGSETLGKEKIGEVQRNLLEIPLFLRDFVECRSDQRSTVCFQLKCHFFEFYRSRKVNLAY